MSIQYCLDTNICIYIAKQKPQSVLEKFSRLSVGMVCMSVITYGELLFGAQKSHDVHKATRYLEELSSLIPPLPMSMKVATYYGEIRAHLEKAGKVIGNNDLWIASHCLDLNAILVTNNVKEFSRVPKLTIENWVD